jgi:hypothetical protein
MAQLRYIGSLDKTLIDVAPLTFGAVITVDDDFAARLVAAYPGEYETINSSALVQTDVVAEAPVTTPEDAAASAPTKKSAQANTTTTN